MRYAINIKIIDLETTLSDVDIHQIENLIWLRLAPWKKEVLKVIFEIRTEKSGDFSIKHIAKISTFLVSGNWVVSKTTRITKGAAIMRSTSKLKRHVRRRIIHERGVMYRLKNRLFEIWRNVTEDLGGLTGSIRQNGSRTAI